MSDQDDEQYFVVVRGGSAMQRAAIRDRLKEMSQDKKANVNLVNIGTHEEDISIHIKTRCGEVEVTAKDLEGNGGVLEAACAEVQCSREIKKPEDSDAAEGD